MARPSKAATALTERLGADLPPGVARLKAADLARIDALVAQAEARQDAAVAEGTERALRHVPRLLRGPLARALRG